MLEDLSPSRPQHHEPDLDAVDAGHAVGNPLLEYDTLAVRELVVGPGFPVDEFIESALQGLKHLTVCSLHLGACDLDTATKFL